jgi:hypothetical protein
MAWNYWYAYECAPSSETRGRRSAHEGGCGHWNVRGTREPIYSDSTVQGSPCKNCGRRQRLNPGIVHMQDRKRYAGMFRPDGTMMPDWTPAEYKEYAVKYAEEKNCRSPMRLAWDALPEPRGSWFDFMREWQSRSNASEQRGEEE